MPIIDGPWLTVGYDRDADLVEIAFRRFVPSTVLRHVLKMLRVELGERLPTRWLCDHLHMKVLASEDVAWIVDEWLPPPCGGGVRVALVDSVDALGRRSVAQLGQRLRAARPSLTLSLFADRLRARGWLLERDVMAGNKAD
jgi:hypothetical protein